VGDVLREKSGGRKERKRRGLETEGCRGCPNKRKGGSREKLCRRVLRKGKVGLPRRGPLPERVTKAKRKDVRKGESL